MNQSYKHIHVQGWTLTYNSLQRKKEKFPCAVSFLGDVHTHKIHVSPVFLFSWILF